MTIEPAKNNEMSISNISGIFEGERGMPSSASDSSSVSDLNEVTEGIHNERSGHFSKTEDSELLMIMGIGDWCRLRNGEALDDIWPFTAF